MASLFAKQTTFDPALASLFASSSGPVQAPARVKSSSIAGKEDISDIESTATPASNGKRRDDETGSSGSSEEQSDALSDSDSATSEEEQDEIDDRPRKRRRPDASEDLEASYLNRLVREEEKEQDQQRKVKAHAELAGKDDTSVSGEDDGDDLDSGLEDVSESEAEQDSDDEGHYIPPKHESQTTNNHEIEATKLKRTVFLGNVSTSAITSKSAKRTLLQHLQTALDTKLNEKVESIRFRSTAFASDAGPKRAAYAKKELMDTTMKSTNAYAVLSSEAAARKVTTRLNSTMVLDRHLRVDNLGSPAQQDNRRCIFVGNLSFVDEETTTQDTEDGVEKKVKKGKEPADVEEGLWRVFGKVGKVESVRVVRDKETRVSKGFAYVQFSDENGVEAGLGLDGRKFPPMLPRVLRVSRAKRIMKREQREKRGRFEPNKGGLKRKFAGGDRRPSADRAEKIVFEGHRASTANAPKMMKKKQKKRPAVRPTGRSSTRGATFKASGGKKKRDEK